MIHTYPRSVSWLYEKIRPCIFIYSWQNWCTRWLTTDLLHRSATLRLLLCIGATDHWWNFETSLFSESWSRRMQVLVSSPLFQDFTWHFNLTFCRKYHKAFSESLEIEAGISLKEKIWCLGLQLSNFVFLTKYRSHSLKQISVFQI